MSIASSIPTPTPTPGLATLDDLLQVDGKAELVGGRIIRFMPNGYAPGRVAFLIAISLELYRKQVGRGHVCIDSVGYAIRPALKSGRQSFCPDASYFTGPLPANQMRFIEGPPDFAVEVRSETDYGKKAESELAAKRLDYFEAGTKIVWDVDPEAKEIRVYRNDARTKAVIFKAGQLADAEPAVPGWKLAVDEVFA
jgi:Uma2 family endonuclease